MKIAIVGYGRMGKCIEQQAKNLGIEVGHIIDSTKELEQANFAPDEVVIYFTAPEVFQRNIAILAKKKVNVVVGTTGWYDDLESVEKLVKDNNIGFLWSSNFSIGVNLFWKIAAQSTAIFDKMKNYDVFLHESHHRMKEDAPSGTAITLSEKVLENSSTKKELKMINETGKVGESDLTISVTRGGNIPGIHSVFIDSPEDTIEITHTARNRDGFALGAVQTARWLNDKKGIFTMQDFLSELN
jgi:4-hydroxy-tetrahydrodipicolinate reductase